MKTTMFSPEIDSRFPLLHPLICQCHVPGNIFHIQETKKGGEADLEITCGGLPCFHVPIDGNAFPVLNSQRCADHLVFVFDPAADAWILHIFEMKRSISKSKWDGEEGITGQFDGGMANACAILGVLRHTNISKVEVHCCYRRNRSESSTAELRAPLGKPAPSDWLNDPVVLLSCPLPYADNRPIKLNKEDGTGSFRL